VDEMTKEPMFFFALSSITTTFFLRNFFHLSKEGDASAMPALDKVKGQRYHLKHLLFLMV